MYIKVCTKLQNNQKKWEGIPPQLPPPGVNSLPGIRERIRSIKTDHCHVTTHAMLQKKNTARSLHSTYALQHYTEVTLLLFVISEGGDDQ